MTKEALQIALEALTDFDYDKRMSAIEVIKEQLETKDEPLITVDDLEQEIYENTREFISFNVMKWMIKKFYSTQQRTWVGLTDEEIQECLQGLPTQTIDVYARRIETKIKEKNT